MKTNIKYLYLILYYNDREVIDLNILNMKQGSDVKPAAHTHTYNFIYGSEDVMTTNLLIQR